jgi:hypothetical protein
MAFLNAASDDAWPMAILPALCAACTTAASVASSGPRVSMNNLMRSVLSARDKVPARRWIKDNRVDGEASNVH